MPKPYIIPVPGSKLWRIVYANSTVSEMVNQSRAKDALVKLLEEYQHNREIDT